MTDEKKVQRPSNVRQIAVGILDRIDTEIAYAEPLLDETLSSGVLVNPHDRALLTEIVYGTLRMRGRLDWIIDKFYRGTTPLETTVRNILRTGLYQIWFTDRIPSFAVVNEAVGIAHKVAPAAAGLVNAILRNALRQKETLAWPNMEEDPALAISVIHSHPLWLVRRLLTQFGREETLAICQANNTVPPLTLRVNLLKVSREEVIASLARDGIEAKPTLFSLNGLRIASPTATLREAKVYREGLLRIQDEAAQLIPCLVAPKPGETVLDLCAGAGGKTLHLAALMENCGRIVALDRHSERLGMLHREAIRLGATIIKTRQGDATAPPAEFREAFDRVLLDAPCSGLGTLRRNPEIRWRLTRTDIKRGMEVQKRLLKSAANCVKRGGRLVYSVCTVMTDENETVVSDLLSHRSDFKCVPPENIPPDLIDAKGFLRTSPHLQGMDGFFAAVLTRSS